MRNHNEIVVLALAAMLVASLLTAGLIPSSFASHSTKTATTPKLFGSQHVPIDSEFEIDAISILAKAKRGSGDTTIEIEILQDGEVKGSSEVTSDDLSKRKYNEVTVNFDPSVNVDGDFDIVVKATGKGIFVKKEKDRDGSVPGHFITAKNKQNLKFDLALEINSVPLEDMKDTFTSGNSDDSNDDSGNPPDNNDSTPPEDNGTGPVPEGKARLTVKAIDQNGNTVVPRMYIAVLQGTSLVDKGFNDATFTLDAAENYMVEMDDYYDTDNAINFDFIEWIGSGHTNERTSVLLDTNKELTARYTVTANSPPPAGPSSGTTSPPPSSDPGTVTAYAYRMPSSNWGPTFTSADAQAYFVLYDSAGEIVYTGFFDENGHVITGLIDGETYWVMPQDCHHCHGGTHDVRFNHWENGDTERARAVTNGMSVGAYYEFVPDTP